MTFAIWDGFFVCQHISPIVFCESGILPVQYVKSLELANGDTLESFRILIRQKYHFLQAE